MRIAPRWVALVLAVTACGGSGQSSAAGTATDTAARAESGRAAADTGSSAGAADSKVVLARAVRPPQGPNAFRHEKHRELPCQRCHASVPGHSMHAKLGCPACHAPVPVTGPVPTPAECASCHHAATQPRACTSCHDSTSRRPLAVTLNWKLSVWPAPRPRTLTFDHGWHTSLQCTACHTDRPAMVPAQPCASCHVHHEGKVDCRVCHRTPPAGVHTVAAHGGCAGSGCHQSPPVKVATVSRDECLLCHPDRVNHEPGRACAQCHMLQPARGQGPQVGKEPTFP